jgi:hypothetical protein
MNEPTTTLELEPAPPSVKRYQRLKLSASLANTIAGLTWLGVFAVLFGPILGEWLKATFPDARWLQLWLTGFALVATLELV